MAELSRGIRTVGEKRMSNSFVYNGTRTMYEEAGFEFVRAKGLKNTVMRRTVVARVVVRTSPDTMLGDLADV